MKCLLYTLLALLFYSCAHKQEKADLVIHNAKIHTLDYNNTTAQAMAIRNDSIIEIGPEQTIRNKYRANQFIDLKKRVVLPAFHQAYSNQSNEFRVLSELGYCSSFNNKDSLKNNFLKFKADGYRINAFTDSLKLNYKLITNSILNNERLVIKDTLQPNLLKNINNNIDLRWININGILQGENIPNNFISIYNLDDYSVLPNENFFLVYSDSLKPMQIISKLVVSGIETTKALKIISSYATMVYRLENQSGTLEVGKNADFIVLDKNIFKTENDKLKDIEVVYTFVKGKQVFSKY